MDSEMLFICIDGANLVGSSTQKKIRNVKTRCAKHINPYLTERCHKGGLPPIGMLVTKYDMCADDTDEVREIVEEAFEGLFGGNDTFVAIIPVSLGDTLEDDNCQGELEPINREPAAIDMIYAKGAWQNEHGRHRFWNDVQSIADYNF